jgi:hypothetical protein
MFSCIKDGNETWYAIQNNTDRDIICHFYAKSGNAYKDEVEILSGENQKFYWPGGTQNNPAKIISNVYDSICITVISTDSIKLAFKQSQVKNYMVNLFTDSQAWKQKSFKTALKTNFATEHISVSEYLFEINKDSIIFH